MAGGGELSPSGVAAGAALTLDFTFMKLGIAGAPFSGFKDFTAASLRAPAPFSARVLRSSRRASRSSARSEAFLSCSFLIFLSTSPRRSFSSSTMPMS
eukprot:Skav225094  [mRNA]  locus=scaffold621:141689:147780:- [translate_table: standard]